MSKYIPGIYQGDIEYILGIYHVSPTLVFTWYIPGIYRLYDNIGDIGGIYHTKTSIHLFGTSHGPPSTGHIPDIYLIHKLYQAYTYYIPGIYQKYF